MLISFLITFVLLTIISTYAFTRFRYSTAFGVLNLVIIAVAVGFREFGYDYYSYQSIYQAIVSGEGYITEWITQLIVLASDSSGIGFKGFLTVYALMNFSLLYVVARMERISLTLFLSVYCILLFSTGPLVTIRSSLSSLIFCIAFSLYFRGRWLQALVTLVIAFAFHGAALAAAVISLLVAFGKNILKCKNKVLFIYFFLISLAIHTIVGLSNISEFISLFTDNEALLMLAGRVEAYQSYVWLDFSSVVHYFQVVSIVVGIICYRLLNPRLDKLHEHENLVSHRQDVFASDVVNSTIVFGGVSFLYFNLVWGVRIMEFMAPLLAILIVKYGQNRRHVPLLILFVINLVNVFLGYMSSLNWKF